MNWYKQSKIENGDYVLDPDGRLHPCSGEFKDCLPYVAEKYNVLTESQDRYSQEYFNEVLDNGFILITLGDSVALTNRKPLNPVQQTTVDALNRNRR